MVGTQESSYSFIEEIINSVTHGAGILLSIAALVLMVVFASLSGSAVHVVSCAIFGVTLILLYTASTLYHGIPYPRVKRILKIFDHCCIYLLIAGTYTPFLLSRCAARSDGLFLASSGFWLCWGCFSSFSSSTALRSSPQSLTFLWGGSLFWPLNRLWQPCLRAA
jgi:channel protein (hemolysin III family)